MGNKNVNNTKNNKEYNIKLIGGMNNEKDSYIIRRIKKGKFPNIKLTKKNFGNEIIIKEKNYPIILNLITSNNKDFNNNKSKEDCIIYELDFADEQNLENIKLDWYNNKENNLIYLIGFKKDSCLKENNIYDKTKKFCDLYSIKFFDLSDKDNDKIISFFNDLVDNLEKEQIDKKIETNQGQTGNYEFRVVFVGESGIGAKSSLINEILHEGSRLEFHQTSNSLFNDKIINLKNGGSVKLTLTDTTGQQSLRSVTNFYIKGSNCAVLGYDITNKESFEELKQYWLPTVKEQIDSNLIYLLGNKCDLYDRETVTEKEAKLFAIDNNLRFFLISCLEGIGIQSFIDDLVERLINMHK